jgi:hypothetical protein
VQVEPSLMQVICCCNLHLTQRILRCKVWIGTRENQSNDIPGLRHAPLRLLGPSAVRQLHHTKRMKTRKLTPLVSLIASACLFCSGAIAGTFKNITIDGSFADWAGVPLLDSDPVDNSTTADYGDIYVANDDNYLYIRFTLHAPADPSGFQQNIFIDADNTPGTGYPANGLGSEMLIQSGAGYQEKFGGFNEAGINGLGWLAAPTGVGTQFEMRIARSATYATNGMPIFSGDTIALELEADASPNEWAPNVPLVYTFASAPAALTTNLPLVKLTNSSWQANAAGTDLGTNWLDQAYDDTQAGWSAGPGLFGYTPSPGSYPTINTPLASGLTTYYFRTRFNWNFLPNNVAFVVTNYLSDGAVYYLNGVELNRVRMPSSTVGYSTSATGTNSPVGQPSVFGIPGGPLIVGENILEVETHQAAGSGGDMVFGLSLTAAAQYPIVNLDPSQPADRTVNGGDSTTFAANLLGSGPLHYQWLRNTSPIPDATNASYTIPQVIYSDAANYSLRVSSPLSTNTTRAAVLTVTNTPVSFANPSQPADAVVVQGRAVTLTSVVAGSPPFSYQWYYGTNSVTGATNDSYTIPFAMPTNAGPYHVAVSNQANSANSRTATVTVLLDTLPPVMTKISASGTQIIVDFSEPLDSVTAVNPAKYSVSGGVGVTGAALNPGDGSQVTLFTSSGMAFGVVYTLTVNGVKDLFGNALVSSGAFTRGILIDGDFSDWAGLTPIYSGPSGTAGAADFKDIYVFNDANNYYFRVTLWNDVPPESGRFPDYANLYYDTDNNVDSGHLPGTIGSELLTQSGGGYQEKNGGFNEGDINNLDWFCLPSVPGTNFEFSISRAARYASDNGLVFTTNTLNIHFAGETPQFAEVNHAPPSGVVSYTNVNTFVPSLPLGSIAASRLVGGKVVLVWDSPGTLQARGSLSSGSWTNVSAAASPYVIPAAGTQLFFRLTN